MELSDIVSTLDPVIQKQLNSLISEEEREKIKLAYNTLTQGFNPKEEQ